MDKLYGASVSPQKEYSNIERHKKPDSVQKLDAVSAPMLKSYLDTAINGLKLTQINHKTIVLLWLLDENGDIWFCLEEMYKADAENSVFPRLDGIDYPNGYEKLGHPSLILAEKARIAGELLWDDDMGRWSISNKSGRYGIREGIKLQHLNNAIKKFQSFQDVEIDFYTHYIKYQS